MILVGKLLCNENCHGQNKVVLVKVPGIAVGRQMIFINEILGETIEVNPRN